MNQQESSPAKAQNKDVVLQSAIDEIAELCSRELLYNFFRAGGLNVIGSPEVFAIYFEKENRMLVYTNLDDDRCEVRCIYSAILHVLDYAKTEGASFNVFGDNVVCVMDEVMIEGKTYDMAAAAAIVLNAVKKENYKIVRSQKRSV
ncbi:hypothetical protein [Chitinibacter tainanensis]|uniref:hypothetical protein n=1 Tax=Chitinibacter tainanensis TaxID=230667 RepID=UPI0012EB4783|nr:hypothetical protein [Chitinibacter tainanensis]